MASVVFLNGDFHFPEHPARNAVDGIAQGVDGLTGIEIEDIEEILVLKVEIRVVGTAGEHGVGDADADRPAESYFDVVYIITLQVAVGNDVEDGLLVALPVFVRQMIGDVLQMIFEGTDGSNAKGGTQGVLDSFSVFRLNPPQLIQRTGAAASAGVGHIEHIPQIGLVTVGDEHGDALGTSLDIPVLLLTPCIVVFAERGVGTLGMDHNLFGVGEAEVPSHGGQEGRPMLSVGGHLVDGVGRHSRVELFLLVHFFPPFYSMSG